VWTLEVHLRALPLTALALLLFATGCEPENKASTTSDETDTDVDGLADEDGDGFPANEDCSDGDASVSPAAVELCNGIDDDCDGLIDEDVTDTWWADADSDGFGDPASAIEACTPPSSAVANANDCDDTDNRVHPGADELCNDIDDDCDSDIDEDVGFTFYADADGDGYGDPDSVTVACEAPADHVDDASDCEDGDPEVHPGATEVCDEVDNDCNEVVDEGVTTTFYIDLDNDGWGGFSATTEACSEPEGYAAELGDCDDGEAAVNPDATEICNEIDDDCDTDIDDEDANVDVSTGATFYLDDDGDGYGDAATGALACAATPTTVTDATDCDDSSADVHPAASEVCNEIDDDCDSLIDGNDPSVDLTTGTTFYTDDDGDGFGDTTTKT